MDNGFMHNRVMDRPISNLDSDDLESRMTQPANQPSNMKTSGSDSSALKLDEFESQLSQQIKDEREQHEDTKQLLRNEQEKVRTLQKKLDDFNRFNNGLAAGIRLQGYVGRAAINRIEPGVLEILEKVTALHGFYGLAHAGTVANHLDSRHLHRQATQESTLSSSSWPDQALQLPIQDRVSQHHSSRYDVMAEERAGDSGTAVESYNFVPIHTKHHAVHQEALHQPDKTDHQEQMFTNEQVSVNPDQPAEKAVVAHNLETGSSGQGEFHSLDQAFETDFFSKPVGGLGASPPVSNKSLSDASLLDIRIEEAVLPKSTVINSGSSNIGALNAANNSQSEDDPKKSVGGPVATSRESPVKHPLGVEIRIRHPVPNKPNFTENLIAWTKPHQLSSLPTLNLPDSFLRKIEQQGSSDSSDSTHLSTSKGRLNATLAEARTALPTTRPQIKALQVVKISDMSNASDETIRPGSPQRRELGLPPSMPSTLGNEPISALENLSVESDTDHDSGVTAFETDLRTQKWVGEVDYAPGLPYANPRPSSGRGDNYKVIPIIQHNYLGLADWKMGPGLASPFNSDAERDRIQNGSDQKSVRFSPFWLHPVRYLPALAEPDIYRTVQIDHIAMGGGIQDVLDEVCFGEVESIVLVDVGNIKGPQGLMPCPHKFARVVFVTELQASRFAAYAQAKRLTICGELVRVYIQMEKTYPRVPEVDEAIFELGMTRILTVFGLESEQKAALPDFLQRTCGVDLVALTQRRHVAEGDDNDRFQSKTVMEFRSILHAARAWDAMVEKQFPGAVSFMIEGDYCVRQGRLP